MSLLIWKLVNKTWPYDNWKRKWIIIFELHGEYLIDRKKFSDFNIPAGHGEVVMNSLCVIFQWEFTRSCLNSSLWIEFPRLQQSLFLWAGKYGQTNNHNERKCVIYVQQSYKWSIFSIYAGLSNIDNFARSRHGWLYSSIALFQTAGE